MRGFVLLGEVGVLVELGLEALDFLEVGDEGGLGGIALEVRHGLRCAGFETLGFHEADPALCTAVLQFLDDSQEP